MSSRYKLGKTALLKCLNLVAWRLNLKTFFRWHKPPHNSNGLGYISVTIALLLKQLSHTLKKGASFPREKEKMYKINYVWATNLHSFCSFIET